MLINVFQSQIEQKIFDNIEQSLAELGFKVVRIRFNQKKKSRNLQIMIDKLEGETVTIDDCEKVSKYLSVLFDADNLMPDERYNLEISSPGIDRPLTRTEDFELAIGEVIRVKTWRQVAESGKFKGHLIKVESESIQLQMSPKLPLITIEFNNIAEAFLEYNVDKLLGNIRDKNN